MKVYIFILPLFFHIHTFAQSPDQNDPVSMAKFHIVKRTVEFLSTDTVSFREVTAFTCNDCTSYDELMKFSRKMKNADQLISRWYKTQVGRTKEDLILFSKALVRDITTGEARKEKRLKYAGYAQYEQAVLDIINGAATANAPAEVAATPAVTDEPPIDAAEEVTDEGNMTPLPVIDVTRENKAQTPWLFIIAAFCALLLALYFFLDRRKQLVKKDSLKRQVKALQEQLAGREDESQPLHAQINALRAELQESRKQFEELSEKRADEYRRFQQQINEAHQPPVPATPAPNITLSKGFVPMVKFARYADKGDGFSSEDLLDQDDNETIFEITITTPDTGAFRISRNKQAQRYALSNAAYFFGNTCTYETVPAAGSEIVTNTPGELFLNGDKWTIRQPAKISFN
ncbi:OmpH family outer membrane protein [Chitinophaga rhizophila]|uniref:OmpH family outer membrane protein n=1 Tax=Chitinophaga rhizophila TaxID=2866212 RepID=A0ABS7GHD7_9BACT|nr:OmpH family outer membrane protein [Chitinophaga rhizophila]MBW8687109.1 OmpH family outer membrane protein [Chitinophaga rhizophila]